jgi:hypothetical protein
MSASASAAASRGERAPLLVVGFGPGEGNQVVSHFVPRAFSEMPGFVAGTFYYIFSSLLFVNRFLNLGRGN